MVWRQLNDFAAFVFWSIMLFIVYISANDAFSFVGSTPDNFSAFSTCFSSVSLAIT